MRTGRSLPSRSRSSRRSSSSRVSAAPASSKGGSRTSRRRKSFSSRSPNRSGARPSSSRAIAGPSHKDSRSASGLARANSSASTLAISFKAADSGRNPGSGLSTRKAFFCSVPHFVKSKPSPLRPLTSVVPRDAMGPSAGTRNLVQAAAASRSSIRSTIGPVSRSRTSQACPPRRTSFLPAPISASRSPLSAMDRVIEGPIPRT